MNAIDRAATTAAKQDAGAHPRIRYIDPLSLVDGAAFASVVSQAASLGFTAILVPPPWAPGASGNRFTPASLTKLNPALGQASASDYIRDVVRVCRQHGLKAMLDLPLASLDAKFDAEAPPFTAASSASALDPRQGGSNQIRVAADPVGVGAWWASHVGNWIGLGLGGLRVLGLEHAPEALAGLRQVAPDLMLIAWTPGMPRDALSRVRGASYVVSSLPWWDFRGDWFWDELAALRQIAPVIACPESPFDPRAAAAVHDPALIAATLRRAAGMAAAIGDGWMVTHGFETGARRKLDVAGQVKSAGDRALDNGIDLTTLNRMVGQGAPSVGTQHLSGGGAPVLALLRTDAADARFARSAQLALLNTDLANARSIDPAVVLAGIDGSFGAFTSPGTKDTVMPGTSLMLAPGELMVATAQAVAKQTPPSKLDADAARRLANTPRVAIEAVTPAVDDGSLPVKRLVGEVITVEADIICDGHEKLGVALQWHEPGNATVHEVRMRALGNDRYRGEMPLHRIGAYDYTIQAWRDAFASYKDEIAKKSAAGIDVSLELREGLALLTRTAERAQGNVRSDFQDLLARLKDADDVTRLTSFLSPELSELMAQADDRPRAATLPRPIRIDAERSGAAFAAWYEVFPRSMSDDAKRHGTFRDVERHLPRVRAMGFDVLYFPPISPIGTTNRKGPNNTLTPVEGDPGSPYAIGSADGGHDALHPELGTLEDFQHLVATAAENGLEIAIDFAIQCSPDHPWLQQHRGWFDWRPDGTIKYAENPPKKYQDIVNVDFYAPDAIPGLWIALAEVVMFWMAQGVRLVRVDNPHTKPLPFWQWMIGTVREHYPDAVFLAEAFTRPKVMYRLAKVGFSQSYTYFTWRETKREMEQYLTELAEPGPRDFFRPHFFVNTPDINPVYLQNAGRPSYLIRAALAATLSGLWGVYNGFELCEGAPLPGREEYLDSEKYQIRVWDWDRPGNIVPEITALNRIRRSNPALRSHLTTRFLPAASDTVSVFLKATPDMSNVLVCAISFDPNQPQDSGWEFPFWLWGADENAAFEAEDLLGGAVQTWRGRSQGLHIDPARPYAIWRIRALF
ncbi:maltotransferase domain-containing protein [Acidisphaera sp. L21]|uniref:maltotransferase domain-containing protein n=1 Tax=Acidisphaera sp. L21 TaxID=1641851 RepID=UPI00131C1E8E|nr:maltotransferase domain-containing protein [Acidisphaera sp. L21]